MIKKKINVLVFCILGLIIASCSNKTEKSNQLNNYAKHHSILQKDYETLYQLSQSLKDSAARVEMQQMLIELRQRDSVVYNVLYSDSTELKRRIFLDTTFSESLNGIPNASRDLLDDIKKLSLEVDSLKKMTNKLKEKE